MPVEEVLQGTPGMTEMVSWSMPNFGFMQLEFALETGFARYPPMLSGHRSAWANGVMQTIN